LKWELFDKLKDNHSCGKIPIVFLTGRTDRIAENAGQFLGNNYIKKPVKAEELRNIMEKTLKEKKHY